MINDDVFLIYQLKNEAATRDYRFESFDNLQSRGLSVDMDNYNHIYTASLAETDTPDSIYTQFNLNHPADFAGHSLSVSNIIVMRRDGEATALYVDPAGFVQVPEFLEERYKYYSTQRPIDIGTIPKGENDPVKISNFDNRKWVENATFRAWGYVTYNEPLTEKQISDYELRPASDNPDKIQLSPYQLEAQVQVVGKWEHSKRAPDIKRLTWWHGDFGVFVKKDFVTNERLTERFRQVVEENTRNIIKSAYRKNKPDLLKDRANKEQIAPKSIASQLAEGAKQATKNNAARPTSLIHTGKDSR